jgi:4-amino-4-deoxy-L-arabinose transferase-like glycosyltransferase
MPEASHIDSEFTGSAVQRAPVWQSISVITAVAFGLRLVGVHFLYRATWNNFSNHLLFGFETGRIASSIAAGHGYGNPLYVETGPTAWMTPVYPCLLAVVFKLFGIYSRSSAFVILCLNALFSALVCIPAFLISIRSFGRRTAVLASWAWALFPASIFISPFVWDTCLSALLLTILFLGTLRLREAPGSRWRCLAFGAAWGLAALTNASILSLFPFLLGWALSPMWSKRRMWLVAAALVGLGLCGTLLPWQLRNYRAFHQLVPLRDTFWLEMWLGNDGNTLRVMDIKAHPTVNPAERAEYVRLGEIRYMQLKRDQALDFVASHPRFFLWLCLRRIVYTWTGFWNLDPLNLRDELKGSSNIFLTSLTTILMLVGLWQAIRTDREGALSFLLVLAVFPLVFYVTHSSMRYRHVIDPEILILAAAGTTFLFSKIRDLFRNARMPASA